MIATSVVPPRPRRTSRRRSNSARCPFSPASRLVAAVGLDATDEATRARPSVMAEKSACTSASTRAAVASSVEPNRQSSVAKPAPSTIPAAVRPAAISRRQLTCRSRGRKRGTRKAGYRKGKLGSSDVACPGLEGGAQTRRAHHSSELAAGGRAIRRRIHAEAAARGARPGWDLPRGAPDERGRRGAHQRQPQRDRSGRLQRDGRKPAGAGRLRRSVPARDGSADRP